MKLKPIHEQVVVLFGATSGIGLETALHMVEKGARVVIAGRSQEAVDQAVERVREHARASMSLQEAFAPGGSSRTFAVETMGAEQQVTGFTAEVTNFDQVKSVADRAVAQYGHIDTWVHLASVSEWALFEDTAPDEFRRIIDVNLTGIAYGAMAALPYLKQQEQGALIFVSSIAGRMPIPYQTAYSASKHGVIALATSLRMELKHTGIPVSVTTILPSSVNTPLFNKSRTKLGVEPHPIPPVYDPSMVAKAIIFAAQHPVREIPVGGSGWMLQLTRRISPVMGERTMQKIGFKSQRSNEPKSAQDPDNLYEHVEGYNQVTGDYSPETKRSSMQFWLATHPKARAILRFALLGGLAYGAYRVIQARRERSFWDQLRFWERPAFRRQVRNVRKSMPFQRKRHWSEVLAGLPLIGLLPFFEQRPSMRKRVQRSVSGVQRGVQRGVKRGMERLPIRQTERSIKRLQERMPRGHKETVIEKVQEKLPGGQHKETVFEKIQERIELGEKAARRV